MTPEQFDHEVQCFADLAILSHDFQSKLKTMALITAYGDESSDKDKRVLAVGAFVGRADEWTALLLDWIERIKPENLPNPITSFHMTDCETGQGEFRGKFGWTEESRKRLIIDLIEIITRRRVLLYGAGLQMKDYGNLDLIDGKPVGKVNTTFYCRRSWVSCPCNLKMIKHQALKILRTKPPQDFVEESNRHADFCGQRKYSLAPSSGFGNLRSYAAYHQLFIL